MEARTRFAQASKKKNDSVLNILTSMMIDAAMTDRRDMIFMTRMTFSTTYPAPAKDFPKIVILVDKSEDGVVK